MSYSSPELGYGASRLKVVRTDTPYQIKRGHRTTSPPLLWGQLFVGATLTLSVASLTLRGYFSMMQSLTTHWQIKHFLRAPTDRRHTTTRTVNILNVFNFVNGRKQVMVPACIQQGGRVGGCDIVISLTLTGCFSNMNTWCGLQVKVRLEDLLNTATPH